MDSVDTGLLFCGTNEQGFAISGVTYKWPVTTGLRWGLGISSLGPLSEMDIKGMYTDIFAEIAAVIDFHPQYTPNWRTANFVVNLRRLDGRGGTLAQAGIPMPNFNANSQLDVEWDDSEAWGLFENPPPGKIDAYRVGLHETLHWFGLGHGAVDPNDPALIEPRYSERIRHLMPRDKKELLRRYKPATGITPVPQPPPVGPGEIKGTLRVVIDGATYEATGPLRKV